MTWAAAGIVIPAATTVAGMIQSGVKQRKARLGLEELQKQPFPEISVSTEMQGAYGQAQAISKYGFSPEETAAFNQNLARTQNTAFQSAIDMSGGQLSGALTGGLQSQKIGAINQFAAEGAGLKLKKIQYAGDIASQIQAIKQANEAQKINYRLMLEQAYGGAVKQQQENINQGIGSLGAIGAQAATSAANQRNFDTYMNTQKTGQPAFMLDPTQPGLGFENTMGRFGTVPNENELNQQYMRDYFLNNPQPKQYTGAPAIAGQ